MDQPNWEKLLKSYEETFDKKKREHDEICIVLDRLMDEIKSGEKIPENFLERIIDNFMKVFQPDVFWSHKQSVCFCLIHVFEQYRDRKELLLKTIEKSLVPLLEQVNNEKRELRDSASQMFGGLISVYGNDFLEKIWNLVEKIENSKKTRKYFELEGVMVCLGDVVSKCDNITEKNFEKFVNVLIKNGNCDLYESYSRYIRQYSTRSLEYIFGSASKKFFKDVHIEKIKENLNVNLNDIDFDVRKANSSLFVVFYEFLFEKEGKEEVLTNMLKELTEKLTKKNFEFAWEYVHSICLCFKKIFESSKLVSILEKSEKIQSILLFLEKVLKLCEKDKKFSQPSSEAGRSIVQYLITTVRSSGTSEEIISEIYEKHVKKCLFTMLGSPHAHMLDASSICLEQLANETPKLIRDGERDDFLCQVFKNRFHASLPVKSTANGAWVSLRKKFYKKEEEELVELLNCKLFENLLKFAQSKNFEIKESSFKGIEYIFGKINQNSKNRDFDWIKKVIKELIRFSEDKSGGFSEEYRAAAIKALTASLKFMLKEDGIKIGDFVPKIFFEKKTKNFLKEIFEGDIVKETLMLVQVMREKIENFEKNFLPLIFCLKFFYEEKIVEICESILKKIFLDENSKKKYFFSNFGNFFRVCKEGKFDFSEESEYDCKECFDKVLQEEILILDFEKIEKLEKEEIELIFGVMLQGLEQEDCGGESSKKFMEKFKTKLDEEMSKKYEKVLKK